MEKTLKLKNYQLEPFFKVLDYKMPFQKSRIKNRFSKIIGEKLQIFDKDRIEILTELSDKNEKGDPVISQDGKGGQVFKVSEENQKKWIEESTKLMNEECIIDLAPSVQKDLEEVKAMVEGSKAELGSRDTAIVEEILELLK